MGYDRGDIFLLILNQMEIHLVQNRKEDCHHDLSHSIRKEMEY